MNETVVGNPVGADLENSSERQDNKEEEENILLKESDIDQLKKTSNDQLIRIVDQNGDNFFVCYDEDSEHFLGFIGYDTDKKPSYKALITECNLKGLAQGGTICYGGIDSIKNIKVAEIIDSKELEDKSQELFKVLCS